MFNQLKRKNEAGFTLVELMVVVAIIGILLVIGVPQYAKFQAKARQTEVKNQLGAVYTAETSFAAENQSYTGCLGQIGFNRDGARQYYWIGWNATPGNTCGPTGGLTCLGYQWVWNTPTPNQWNQRTACVDAADSTWFTATVSDGAQIVRTDLPAASIVAAAGAAASTFTIGGAGRINRGANAIDTWTIDQAKNLVNTRSGL